MEISTAKRLRKGTLVKFNPNAASLLLYSRAPNPGTLGRVSSVSFGGGVRKSYLPGPGGGLLYVDWDDIGLSGVGAGDAEKVL